MTLFPLRGPPVRLQVRGRDRDLISPSDRRLPAARSDSQTKSKRSLGESNKMPRLCFLFSPPPPPPRRPLPTQHFENSSRSHQRGARLRVPASMRGQLFCSVWRARLWLQSQQQTHLQVAATNTPLLLLPRPPRSRSRHAASTTCSVVISLIVSLPDPHRPPAPVPLQKTTTFESVCPNWTAPFQTGPFDMVFHTQTVSDHQKDKK